MATVTDNLVTISVDGRELKARKGAMLIEATDSAGIYVPRFCYHEKLAVAANCRMCLVEVEKAPKPLPACATPVAEGMKVFTRSPKALDAQKATMEFLLINHPLDCPICDQGGECELQDLAMGYGADASRYTERKRVVRDKDIGPLIQTDMTRCIHCTRCVRFGEEIAGLRELGATGRGEHMEIGTYIAKSVTSELSGNVIDLCPVGALTSKPYRYSARAWELRQFDGVAPHDCVGSNVYVHVKGQTVKRVVPRENEGVNEVWLSDRDRYSYEGLCAGDRLLEPRVKHNGQWRVVPWETALAAALEKLQSAKADLGVLISPSSTLEEAYLAQALARGLGSANVDHRLRTVDFSDQADAPLYPWLGQTLEQLERSDAILVIGGDPRHEQPLVNHRIRKAARRGAAVAYVNSVGQDLNYPALAQLVLRPSAMPRALGGIARALSEHKGAALEGALSALVPSAQEQAVAAALAKAERASVLVGIGAHAHPRFALLRTLAAAIARFCDARLGYLTEGANAAGCALAGAVPHRGPGGARLAIKGLTAAEMLSKPLRAYLLLGIEPDLDGFDGNAALGALQGAEGVVALTGFATPALEANADVLLPVACYAENEGTFINLCGAAQSFARAVAPPGEARPAWKVLRMLGSLAGVADFAFSSVQEVRARVGEVPAGVDTRGASRLPAQLPEAAGGAVIERVWSLPMYAGDALVRRAKALQRAGASGDGDVRVNPSLLRRLGLGDGQTVRVQSNGAAVTVTIRGDARVPDGAAHWFAAQAGLVQLGGLCATVTIEAASA
jgi:NADH-quinone oxidoreductase subunit G